MNCWLRTDCNNVLASHVCQGLSIPEAVSHWLPTAVAWVQARVRSCGEQCGDGAGFLQVLWFPLPIFIPPIAPQSPSPIIWGWYNRSVVAAVPSGLSLTPLRIIIKELIIVMSVTAQKWLSAVFRVRGATKSCQSRHINAHACYTQQDEW
jgi:hypothetical protein